MLSLWLIALHMLGDYILQTGWMAANKFRDWKARTIHVVCYTAPFLLFSLAWLDLQPKLTDNACLRRAFAFSGGVFVLHWITDCRRWASDKQWCAKPIMVDQTLHLLQLAVLGSIFL